jgi:hypothetical protein
VKKPDLMTQLQMTFDVDPALQADFAEAVTGGGRSREDVLRDLMRAYIGPMLRRKTTAGIRPISKAERRRRANAVNFARASVTLEGFQRSEEAEANAQRFICGEIELREFLAPGCREMEERVAAVLVGAPWSG